MQGFYRDCIPLSPMSNQKVVYRNLTDIIGMFNTAAIGRLGSLVLGFSGESGWGFKAKHVLDCFRDMDRENHGQKAHMVGRICTRSQISHLGTG